MRDHWQSLLSELNYQPGETIIDIGGAMDPCPLADIVVDVVNLGRGGKEYFLCDITTYGLPFPDKSFDICLCSQTLEDLTNPSVPLLEMKRIAKRGIIESPYRGYESVPQLHNAYKVEGSMDIFSFGCSHHKWLIEDINGKLVFTPKIYYYLMKYPIPKWTGEGQIHFLWNDSYEFELNLDIFEHFIDENYRVFRENNRRFWE